MAERIHQERQLRRAGILPVHIRGCDAYGKDISQVACTLNISKHGVRLVGLMRRLKVRSTVWLRYHQEEGRFQVVWARKENGLRPRSGERLEAAQGRPRRGALLTVPGSVRLLDSLPLRLLTVAGYSSG
jgi:hypothetical protein